MVCSTAEIWVNIVRAEIRRLPNEAHPQESVSTEPDGLGRTPLHYAAEYGLEEAARLLSSDEHRPSSTSVSESTEALGISPLTLAVSNSHESIVRILAKAKPGQETLPCGLAFVAIQKGDLEILAQLLALGVK